MGKWTSGISGPKFVFLLVLQQYFQTGIQIIHNLHKMWYQCKQFHMNQPADKFSGSLFLHNQQHQFSPLLIMFFSQFCHIFHLRLLNWENSLNMLHYVEILKGQQIYITGLGVCPLKTAQKMN